MRLAILISFFIFFSFVANAQIYVATNGSDKAKGTKHKPLATVHMALRKARELRRLNDASIANGIHIYIDKGVYRFSEPLFVRPEDAGTETSPTIIEAATNEQPVFSGGVKITGWKKLAIAVRNLALKAKGKVWVTDVPSVTGDLLDFRQLWVNNKKAIRARDKNGDEMSRILSWNRETEKCWIPKPDVNIAEAKGIELVIIQWWAIANLRVKSAEVKGDSVLLSFHQPESRIQSEHPWPAPWISKETGNSAFYLTNAIQFLDEPGEWYLDKAAQKLYYWPRSNENLTTATVIAPVLENLVKIEGSADHPVSHIIFKNISFQHTSWLRPSKQGHVPHQAGMYMLDAYKLKQPGTPDKKTLENQAWVGRPAAAIEVSFASNINFEGCGFQHFASTGLDYGKGVKNSFIKGNLFKDIGGTAILAGLFSDEATEVHLPYNPKNEKEIAENIVIANNLVHDATNEDWGCVGIGVGYVRNTTIEHNDISEVAYTGISVGWGWTKTANVMQDNKVVRNKIHHYGKQLYDCAAIYTLSAQPGTIISENYIDSIYKAPYAHISSHWFYLYTDEGSSGITIKNNWTPSTKFLQNANGPGNVWENNGQMVSAQTRQSAGLQSAYQKLLKERTVNNSWPVNREQPVIIELTTANNQALDIQHLKSVLIENKINPEAVYQWQNHYVVFDKVQDAFVLKSKIQKAFPGVETKVYYDSFYEYNRSYCSDTSTAKEWEHILLTANLVDDTKLQKEYMDYHATQFEKWPEIAKGFCNASFQQLLLYRNGKQLMLVISIPKGESLDKLNPKTTENNPRVNDWNKIMGKYQEGIKGTKPGEKWVFLKKINN